MIGKGTETVFGYTLRNAWGSLLSRIRVMDGPDGGYAEYVVCPEKSPYASYRLSPEDGERIKISGDDLKRIRLVLEDERLFETEELEYSVHQMILDGYQQEFEITCGDRHIIASGSNIQASEGDTEHCLHSVLMAGVLEKIREILVPIGVPEECLKLTGS